ncbi:hypothetical protein M1L60_10750 [Actinoplanes sp. TRM 88003]|uniref:Uncharacterized protein n=1 Tax=Paractinoplanes aksuensis TaxID=2939490 RepID=A0ABT1DLX3_9ACTN|nr:hypothetical protein [Actinoplanes aksuensis]MCO8271071.1 hypothetical protein [Actinoplanes aksuensis]
MTAVKLRLHLRSRGRPDFAGIDFAGPAPTKGYRSGPNFGCGGCGNTDAQPAMMPV